MFNVDYAVIIVSYQSSRDAEVAIRSVIQSKISDAFVVILVENGPDHAAAKALESIDSRIHVLAAPGNLGFARGNNAGVMLLTQLGILPKYLVFMNPDVEILSDGTIETLMSRIDENAGVVGSQPLVWDPRASQDASCQLNIRSVPSFWSFVIGASWPLKVAFKRFLKDYLMTDKMPYEQEILFEIPSGAFFVVNYDIFLNIGMFDEYTFLFNEELILGWKLREKHFKLRLVPTIKVKHEQGHSTGISRYKTNFKLLKAKTDGEKYFSKTYLGAKGLQMLILHGAQWLDKVTRMMVNKLGGS